MKNIVFFILYQFPLILILVGCSTQSLERPTTQDANYAAVLPENQGAVASVNPLATAAGVAAMQNGGNAIDAALAVAFMLGVVDSHNSGIGGGCFIIARLADGRIIALDGRETAPARAHRDMYIKNGEFQPELSKTGALASGIPGSVAALHQLQALAGQLSFSDVVLPAAKVAGSGFHVDKTLAERLASQQEKLEQFPATAKIFLNDQGEPWQVGDRLVQKDLAKSYRALAKEGPGWFYQGEFAEKTAAWMKANGGLITRDDFRSYHTVLREPVRTTFAGHTIVGFPPPSSGGTHVAQILNMLEGRNIEQMSVAQRTHLLAEVMRRAFADRAYWLGDADFVDVPKALLSPAYASERMSDFRMQKMTPDVQEGTPYTLSDEHFRKHTTHIATADAGGNWVAITTTLNTSFGSKVVIPSTGVLLNNQMDDFSAQPGVPNAFGLIGSEANSIAGGKRPLSSMSPTLVLRDGKPVMTVGAAGGPTIISQVAQALINRLALEYDLEKAIAAPRIHHQWQPPLLFVEPAMPDEVEKALSDKGHTLKNLGNFGATQAIEWRNGRFIAVTEPRLISRNR